MKEKNQNCIGEYGIVKIIGGKYKGRFAYYDDDDCNDSGKEGAILYFGDILYNSKSIWIPYQNITTNYTMEDLQSRSNEIITFLFQPMSDKERVLLVEEKNLIDLEIISRLESYIDTSSQTKKTVFLSHSSKDKETVISIALDLEKHGIHSWLDAFDILPGESIIEKINEGLSNCSYAFLFLSKNSVQSKWVLKEWETLFWDEVSAEKIKIIPIKLDDCKIPKILQTKKYIDFSKGYNEALFEMITTLKRLDNLSNSNL